MLTSLLFWLIFSAASHLSATMPEGARPHLVQLQPPALAGDTSQAVTGKGTPPAKPPTALFHHNQVSAGDLNHHRMNWSWLWLGLYVLSGLLFGGLSGYAALTKGLAPRLCFFLGLFLNVFGYLYVLMRPAGSQQQAAPGLRKVPSTAAPIPCPHCSHPNHPAAKKCAGCNSELQPIAQSDLDRLQGRQSSVL